MPEQHSLEAAIAWVNATAGSLDREDILLPTARGRVLTEPVHASGPIPGNNRAALDGFAVQASASFGQARTIQFGCHRLAWLPAMLCHPEPMPLSRSS